MMHRFAPLLLLAACVDAPAPPPAATTTAPAVVVTRYDGGWTGQAQRDFGSDSECGPARRPVTLNVSQGRAAMNLPQGGEGAGTVSAEGAVTLRSRLDAAQRAEGRFGQTGFTARMLTRSCAWTITLNRVG